MTHFMPLQSTMRFSRHLTAEERDNLSSISDLLFDNNDDFIDPYEYFEWVKLEKFIEGLRPIYHEARQYKKLSICGCIIGKKGRKENGTVFAKDTEKSFAKITCKKKETKSQDIYARCSKIGRHKKKIVEDDDKPLRKRKSKSHSLKAKDYELTPEENKKMHKLRAKDYLLD